MTGIEQTIISFIAGMIFVGVYDWLKKGGEKMEIEK